MPLLLIALIPQSPQEIIDLTCEDMSTEPAPWSSLTIIDLTEDTCSAPASPPHTTGWADQDPGQPPAALAADTSHPQLCSTTAQETGPTAGLSLTASWHSAPMERSATTDTAETTENWSCFSPTASRCSSSSPEQNCSTTTFNSDLGSLASMQLDSDLLSPSPSTPGSGSSWRPGGPEEETPHLCQQWELPPRLSPVPAVPTSPGEVQGPLLAASDLSPYGTIQQVTAARTKADSKAWLNKLQYFRRSGIQHLFVQGIAPNWETQQVNKVQSSLCGRGWSGGSPCSTSPFGGSFATQLRSLVLQFPSQWVPHHSRVPQCLGELPFTYCLVLHTAET